MGAGDSSALDIKGEGWGSSGNHASDKRENCSASTGRLTLLQENQEGWDAKGTAGNGTWKWGVAGMCRDQGMRGTQGHHPVLEAEWPRCGGQQEPARKGVTEGFMSTAIMRESQLSVTTLNLVRERRRGPVSSGQVGRFNSSVPQHNHRMSPQHWQPLCGKGNPSWLCLQG